MTLFSYVLVHDTGFAPNPFWDYCTLATCKPKIRQQALPGDWVLGMGSPNNVGNGKLVCAMQVDEVLTIEQYDKDPRFVGKKPKLGGGPDEQCGDNIYFKNKTGKWQQRPSFHQPKHMKHDLGVRNVLVSRHFFYFGSNAVTIPARLSEIIHGGIGHSCRFPAKLVERFLKWLHANHEPGRHGEPSNYRRGNRDLC